MVTVKDLVSLPLKTRVSTETTIFGVFWVVLLQLGKSHKTTTASKPKTLADFRLTNEKLFIMDVFLISNVSWL